MLVDLSHEELDIISAALAHYEEMVDHDSYSDEVEEELVDIKKLQDKVDDLLT